MTDREWLVKFWEARHEAERWADALERAGSRELAAMAYLARMQRFNREVAGAIRRPSG